MSGNQQPGQAQLSRSAAPAQRVPDLLQTIKAGHSNNLHSLLAGRTRLLAEVRLDPHSVILQNDIRSLENHIREVEQLIRELTEVIRDWNLQNSAPVQSLQDRLQRERGLLGLTQILLSRGHSRLSQRQIATLQGQISRHEQQITILEGRIINGDPGSAS